MDEAPVTAAVPRPASAAAARPNAGGIDLGAGPLAGTVCRVDSSRVDVEISDPEMMARVTVSDLVAMGTGAEFLIGLVDSVTQRRSRPGDDRMVDIRIMPIGHFAPRGGRSGVGRFRRGAAAYPHVGGECHLIDGPRLRAFMSVVAAEVGLEERLVLGRYVAEGEALAVADGNTMFQRHVALLGSTGAGKSWAVALLLERASRLAHANLVVFDLHGEYGPLTRPADGHEPIARGLRVAGANDLRGSSDDLLFLPYWLLERDELMSLVLNPGDPHAPDQVVRFTQHVQTLKGVYLVQAGREDTVPSFTVDSPIPYSLGHLVQMLRRDDTEQVPQPPSHRLEPGPYFGRLTSLVSRVEARIGDPRYGFIFTPPDGTERYEWLTETMASLLDAGRSGRGIKIIDLSEVPSAILPMVVGVLARLIYAVQFWMDPRRRTPVCLVCDEAHLYLPSEQDLGAVGDSALQVFEAIAKEGRKYGVGLMVVSQRPTDVNRTILSQCNNFMAMRMTNDADQNLIRRLVPETLSGVTDLLPVLDTGEAVVIGDALLLPTRLRFDRPAVAPASGTRPYWSLWATQASDPDAIAAGVEALRNQMRGGRA
jgi:hypothetical protein